MIENFCSCGCGEIAKKGNRFVHGHNSRSEHPMQDRKHSEETRKKLSEAAKGRKFSMESIEKIRQAALKQWVRQKEGASE